jgi:succinate dehydrogenase/fumarate reductase-like Fe-S protein
MKRLFAFFLLGIRALFIHPVRALFTSPDKKGKAGFLKSYAPEALVPATPQDRADLMRFTGCVNCGLCDAVCPLVPQLPPSEWRGPSLFALAYSRASPELPHLRGAVAILDLCGTCTRCRDVCPRGVPLLDIFAFTRRKLAQVDAVRSNGSGSSESTETMTAPLTAPGFTA